MAAVINEAKNILHINTFVLCVFIENVALVEDRTFPTSSANTERPCSCVDGSCIPCFSVLVMMQQISLSLRSSHHLSFGFDPPAPDKVLDVPVEVQRLVFWSRQCRNPCRCCSLLTCCWLPCCGAEADPYGTVASRRKRVLLQYINKLVDVFVVLVVQVPQVQFLDNVVFMPVVGLHGPDSASFTSAVLVMPKMALMVQTVQKPVEVPQVQFLGMVDVPVVCTSSAGRDSAENCGGPAVAVHRLDKVVDAPVVVQLQGGGPDSVCCLEALVVPQLQFIDILVDFPLW